MGWVGRSLGDFGSQVGGGYDIAQQWKQRAQAMAMAQARQKNADLQMALQQQELQQRVKEFQQKQAQSDPNAQIAAVEKLLGRPMTPQEREQFAGFKPTPVAKYENQRITEDGKIIGTNTITGKEELVPGSDQFKVKAPGMAGADEPLGTRVPQLNSALAARYQVLNPHKDLPSFFALPPNATQKDFENIDKILQATEQAGAKGEEQAGKLSPDATEAIAQVYMKTGQLPPLGMGGVALREQIFNRVGEILSGKGKPSSDIADPLVARQSAFRALQSSLTQLQRQRSAVGAFESTALKNLDMFVKTAQPIVDKGSPWINKPIRLVERKGLGDADLAAFNAARQVALTEISRVISNPNMTGMLTDEARGQVGALIGDDATLKQILSASNILKQDMENRRTSLDDEIANVSGQIVSGTKPQPTQAQPSAAPTKPSNATHTGISSVDGKKYWLDASGKKIGLAP